MDGKKKKKLKSKLLILIVITICLSPACFLNTTLKGEKNDLFFSLRRIKMSEMFLKPDRMVYWMSKFGKVSDKGSVKVILQFLWNGQVSDPTEVKVPKEIWKKDKELVKKYIADLIYARGVTVGVDEVRIQCDKDSQFYKEVKEKIIKGFQVAGEDPFQRFKNYVNFGRGVKFSSQIRVPSKIQQSVSTAKRFDPDKDTVIGIDIGGNRIKAVMIKNGKEEQSYSEATNFGGANALFTQIKNIINKLKGDNKVDAIGITIPGPVHNGEILRITNFENKWKDKGLNVDDERKGLNDDLSQLGSSYGKAVVAVVNDANAGGFGITTLKQKELAGNNQIVFGLGTGVGFVQILDGQIPERPYEGGHIPVVISEDAWKCGCGAIGCLEAYAGTDGIIKLAKAKNLDTILHKPNLTPKDVGEAAANENSPGHKQALEVWQKVAQYIAEAIVVSFNDLGNPDEVILTGGIMQGETGNILIGYLKSALDKLKVTFPEIKDIKITLYSLNDNELTYWGAYGAAQYANMVQQLH